MNQESVLALHKAKFGGDIGWDHVIGAMFKLDEEFTELTNAIVDNFFIRKPSQDVALELADCMIVLYCIALHAGVDLDQAFKDKLLINWNREFYKDENGQWRHVDAANVNANVSPA